MYKTLDIIIFIKGGFIAEFELGVPSKLVSEFM